MTKEAVDYTQHAAEIIAYLRGYDAAEVIQWSDEADPDYDVDIASDLAEITSRLRNITAED